jgi:hypothetical protein
MGILLRFTVSKLKQCTHLVTPRDTFYTTVRVIVKKNLRLKLLKNTIINISISRISIGVSLQETPSLLEAVEGSLREQLIKWFQRLTDSELCLTILKFSVVTSTL